MLTARELIEFEQQVADEFEKGLIRRPIHLSGGNEEQLIEIFKEVHPEDWVFSTWRWHYHALLHGAHREDVLRTIRTKGMNASFFRFYSSAIVGGILPIATGVAAAFKRDRSERKVWVFVGDMTATTGIFHECWKYSGGHNLPMKFVVEDNRYSTNTPTEEVWGMPDRVRIPEWVAYERTYPHCGVGKWVQF